MENAAVEIVVDASVLLAANVIVVLLVQRNNLCIVKNIF